MAVVIAANRVSPMPSDRALVFGLDDGSSGTFRGGERPGESDLRRGRHFMTASTEARQGCTCRGYENITRTTIAALPTVEDIEGPSSRLSTITSSIIELGVLTHADDIASNGVAE